MNIMAFETSTDLCSLALEVNGQRYHSETIGPKVHSRTLLPEARALLKQAGLEFSDLNGVAVGTGPGGFTSLRLGLSVAQGLALAHQMPIYPVSSLLNVAMAKAGCDEVWVLMDARMGEVYAQHFRSKPDGSLQATDQPLVVAPKDLLVPTTTGRLVVVGNALVAYEADLAFLTSKPGFEVDATALPSALRALDLRGESVEPWALVPQYVRDQVTS